MAERSKAVTKIRHLFRERKQPMTLRDIRESLPELEPHKISMTLCYLLRQKYVMRDAVPNKVPKERKTIWQYTYDDNRFAETAHEN